MLSQVDSIDPTENKRIPSKNKNTKNGIVKN